MTAFLPTLLLLVAVVTGATNQSFPEDEICPAAILSRVQISPDMLPVALLASTRLLLQMTYDQDWDEWSKELLDTNPDILSAAIAHHTGRIVVVYQESIESSNNSSSSSYLKTFESTWNKTTPGFWSPPFWDCVLNKWIFGYSAPVQERRSVVGLFYPLDRADLDHCDEVLSPLFGEGHKCDLKTTKCISMSGYGTRSGGYRCACLPGYTSPPLENITLDDISISFDKTLYSCVPSCGPGRICTARQNILLRTLLLGAQLFCIATTILLAVIVFRKRKCKTIAAGMWTILETIIFGIILLYFSVVVHFFEPSIERCLLEPWCRELGFIICYGAIILKLYRILMEFRTRKAHRWVVRDKDLLKYLMGMVLIMTAYLSAWTAVTLNFLQEGFTILRVGETSAGFHFQACKTLWWDYVTEAGELVILLFGLHLGLAARNATVQFEERRFLCLTVALEALVSCIYYIMRALYWESLHPDTTFIANFARSQFSSTLVLMLIFTPKVWYQHKQVRDSRHQLTHELSDAYKPQDGLHYGEMDVSEVNLADMNPDDIRAELKRLYTQYEILKNKTIRQNNPHISKRRGGRKVAHRRFSLQALQHRHQRCSTRPHGPEGQESGEVEISRTPEDSICSMEGPSAIYNDGPSTYSELGGFGTPNVLHRAAKN
ncbi:G-protein coupled receptor 158 smog isoform X2 [Lycorma delicatula]|uniref:G-protein coupled receptor 158 smog isoform X2 n=1 Tax=Lycorma delicatula TaxID=130591 RepID=UPI003F517523